MLLRAFFNNNCRLWPLILSAAWITISLVITPTVKAADDIFKCDFEFDKCGIQQSGEDWDRKSGATSSMDAGPEGGYNQSKFYFFPDDLKKQQVSEFATPDLSSSEVVCIQFAYTNHGTKIGKMILYSQWGIQTTTRTEIWQSPDVSTKNWVFERLPYSVDFGDRIIWQAMSGGTGEEMAVDSILIVRGACVEVCENTEWEVEEEVISPGGIYFANLNTADLCKDQCILSPQCLAVDLVNEGMRVLCYLHFKSFSLREVIKVAGASQNTIITRCETAGMRFAPTPSTVSGCRPVWTKRSNFFSLGGVLYPDVLSASACRDTCFQERSCLAVDVQWADNAIDESIVCRLHFDRTKLSVPLLMPNTEQWEIVDRCTVVDVEKSRNVSHKPLEKMGCPVQWKEKQNTHYVGGTYFTAPNNVVLMPRTCLAECLADSKCVAVDINFGRSLMECWLFTSIANRSKSYSTANIRHYYLTKGCVSEKAVLRPEDDDGSGSDEGEGSGGVATDTDIPVLLKPEVCKAFNWERLPDFYSLGGTKSTNKSQEECLDDCVSDANCQGIDYHKGNSCITHQEASDFYYVLSSPGWIQYQLISDCGKLPSKERPAKADVKSVCTRGVIQKEFLRSPGAVYYGKVSGTWQCLDLCIHSKKCMAAEVRKINRGLNCYYHYRNINFDVLLTSDDSVLYVLSKQCIRLRDSDLAQFPKKSPSTVIPIIVDLDKDDTVVEPHATFCEDVTCYLIMVASLKWKEAQTECEMSHGKLASIKDPATQDLIEKMLQAHRIRDALWIGASVINDIEYTSQSVALWRVVQGTGLCTSDVSLSEELLNRAVKAQGCFMEAKEENEKEFMYTADVPPRNFTPASCLEECKLEDFDYAGVRDGSVCTCGDSFGMYGPASDCVELCQGDYSQFCGGIGAHAVFKTDAISNDFSMWNYNEPKNTSMGHWCGALDMFELDSNKKKLASRPCNEDLKFLCQTQAEACETGPDFKTMSWGQCVYFGQEEGTWHQARMHCMSLDGDLLILDSAEKRQEVQLAVKIAFPSNSKRFLWIGLYSRVYYWDDLLGGSELCYSKFSQGEPVFQKNCLYLDPRQDFEWFSGSCENDSHYFLCEIDTSKGELPLKLPSRPKAIEEQIAIAEGDEEGEEPWLAEPRLEEKKPKPQEGRMHAAASSDNDNEGGGGGGGLSDLEVGLIAAIGVVAVALLVGGAMYGISRQRNRAASQQQQQPESAGEMHEPPPNRGPAEPATSESRTASRQPSSLSASQQQSGGVSPSLKQSRESQSVRYDGAPGSGVDSTSGGAPLSVSPSSAEASGASTKGSTKGD